MRVSQGDKTPIGSYLRITERKKGKDERRKKTRKTWKTARIGRRARTRFWRRSTGWAERGEAKKRGTRQIGPRGGVT